MPHARRRRASRSCAARPRAWGASRWVRRRSAGWSCESVEIGLDKAEGTSAMMWTVTGGSLRNKWRVPPVPKCSSFYGERPVLLRTPFTGRARHALSAPVASARPNPTLILGVILATYLMIILDATVVITALPSIAERLDFSPAALS